MLLPRNKKPEHATRSHLRTNFAFMGRLLQALANALWGTHVVDLLAALPLSYY
jgi:hypothetical protein